MSVYAKEYGYFFNSNNNDRTYNAESFETWLKPFFVSGVFAGCLQVKAQTTPDMTVEVLSGYANLDGKPAYWPDDNTLTLEAASGVYDRIDTIVLRRDNTNRRISIEVVKGTASANPQPTAPARTSDLFELVLAEILVGTGVTEITQSVITDKRPDTDVCGYVVATVETPDFSELYAQFTAQAEEYMDTESDLFDDWFALIRGQLDEDAAGHLQNELDDLADSVAPAYDQTQIYLEGDKCTRGTVLYKRKSWGETTPAAEAWDATHWDQDCVSEEIDATNAEVARISDSMTYVVNGNKSIETVSIPKGAYFRLANSEIVGRSDGMYTAKAAIPVNTVIDSSYFNEASPIVGGGLNALKDNIPQIVTNTNGTAYKFPNGMMICSKNVVQAVSYSQWGSCYESSIITYGDWPVAFKSNTVPFVTVASKNSSSSSWVIGAGSVTATSAGQGRVIRPNNPGEGSASLDITGIGMWK